MARIQERTARKDYPANGIKKGDRYFFVAIKTGPRSSRTIRSLTRPKRWELTSSDFYSQLWPIEDEGFDGIDDAGGLRDIAEQLRELGGEQQEKLDSMPEGLQQGDTGQLLQERVDGCEGWADEIDTAADALEEALSTFDDAVESCKAHLAKPSDDEPDVPEGLSAVSDVEDEDLVAQQRQNLIDEAIQSAQDANPGIG